MKASKSQLAQIMVSAWAIAKTAAVKFGGSSKQYLSGAMKQAWAAIKAPSKSTIDAVKEAIARFSFTAFELESGEIIVKNKKNQLAATVINSVVTQKKSGSQNLCGALVRDAINAVI